MTVAGTAALYRSSLRSRHVHASGHQGRVDRNHADIVDALRKCGCTIQSLARIGGGCPDILVARAGRLTLMEIKAPGASPNEAQRNWANSWNAPVHIVHSLEEALLALAKP